MYYKDNTLNLFAQDERLDALDNYAIDAKKLKCISKIYPENISKEFFVFFRKDENGKIDKNTSELLDKLIK